jgi:hypothetical protein
MILRDIEGLNITGLDDFWEICRVYDISSTPACANLDRRPWHPPRYVETKAREYHKDVFATLIEDEAFIALSKDRTPS